AAYRALALQPWDVRAHHAVAHVMEMQGRFEEGIRWLGARSALWTCAGAASTHLWWHIALYHLELGRPEQALAIYDHRMQGGSLAELIDASALLWRLQLAGVPLEKRFHAVATRWSPYAEDAYCAFNDLHAMMAFVGGQRPDDANRLLAALERRVARPSGANHDMTRLVGLPASRPPASPRLRRLRPRGLLERRGAPAGAAASGAPHRRQPRAARRAAPHQSGRRGTQYRSGLAPCRLTLSFEN